MARSWCRFGTGGPPAQGAEMTEAIDRTPHRGEIARNLTEEGTPDDPFQSPRTLAIPADPRAHGGRRIGLHRAGRSGLGADAPGADDSPDRSEEHTSELQSRE